MNGKQQHRLLALMAGGFGSGAAGGRLGDATAGWLVRRCPETVV